MQTQLCSPLNKGLFQKAIIMSGAFLGAYNRRVPGETPTLSDAEKTGKHFFKFIGAKNLAEARKVPAQELVDKYIEWRDTFGMRFGTAIDGNFCPGSVQKNMRSGNYNEMPIIIGHTRDEFLSAAEAKTEEELKAQGEKVFGKKNVDKWLKLIDAPYFAEKLYKSTLSPGEIGARVILDAANKRAKKAKKPINNYYYQFDADIPGWDDPGAFHSSDLWFFFGSLAACWRPFTGKHFDLAEQMCSYWCNFFKTGDPNGFDRCGRKLPTWEPYNEDRSPMTFIQKAKMGGPEDESEMTKFAVKVLK